MIQLVRIENFRALKEVRVELRPLTVLVGPNDSGKTSFLEAIDRKLRNNIPHQDWWRESDAAKVSLYEDPRTGFSGDAEIFKLPSDGIPMESEGVADTPQSKAPMLEVTGGNLAAFLDYLLRRDRGRFDRIQATLQKLVPGLEDISITTPSPSSRAIYITIEGGFGIPGQRLSTGVRMLFFFVALAHHPNPPDVALIEEPENGVHPKRLKDIVHLLRGLTQGELSRQPVQVILSTHSPYLLDHIQLPQDQVIVFRREQDGRRSASAVDREHLEAFLGEFMLGEVWFNQGEEGLLAANR